jgi:hypothetical protein
MPPMPERAKDRLKARAEWLYSTRTFKESPANLPHFVRKAIGGASPDYVLVASVGEAPASAVLHYYLIHGILQLFLQVGWGGPGAGPGGINDPARECLALAHELVRAVPAALYRGLLDPGGRLTVVATDRGDSFWEAASAEGRLFLTSRPARRTVRNRPGPREILGEAARWCRAKPAETRQR